MKYRATAIFPAVVSLILLCACAGTPDDTQEPMSPVVVVEQQPAPIETAVVVDPAPAKPEGWERFVSEEIYFDQGGYSLDGEDLAVLREKAAWLKTNPGVNVVIQGHADETGSAEYNFALGDRRAGEVKSYLIGMGVEPARLTVVSFGREMPVTRSGDKSLNRRVRFEIDSVQKP